MLNLHVFYEIYTNGYKAEFLDMFSLISVLFGILIIVSKNPIVSVLFLIGLFLSISIYLIMLGINFIGISYLLVYVGAVTILFLFSLMLINIRVSELISYTSNSIPLAIITAISFDFPTYEILPYNNSYKIGTDSYVERFKNLFDYYVNNMYNFEFINYLNKKEVIYASSKNWDGSLAEASHISSIGNIMYTTYSIWLIITSIILLLAMVGAIVITINQKK